MQTDYLPSERSVRLDLRGFLNSFFSPSEHAVQVLLRVLLVVGGGGFLRAVLVVVVAEDGHHVVVAEVDRLVHRRVPPPAAQGDRSHVTAHYSYKH